MELHDDMIVICAASRTPIGALQGSLSMLSASDLGAITLKETLRRATVKPEMVDECFMGCVLSAGQGQAPARQAALKANLPNTLPCTTLNKICGSGMKAVMTAHDTIKAGTNEIVLAGGMESMSNAPYLLDKARSGYRMGHGEVKDHMFLDGLEDAYDKGTLMGVLADNTAKSKNLSRKEQDDFTLTSLDRAIKAQEKGLFDAEIIPVEIKTPKNTQIISQDEGPLKARPEKIPDLKPAFAKDGTVTAANASSISDGASALLLAKYSVAKAHNLPILAVIHGHSSAAQKPADFCLSPIKAIKNLCDKVDWDLQDVDLFEINEAFALVTYLTMQELNLPHEKVNINGGACALGHPIGATGARIITTLIHALKEQNLKKGVASLCIGGGEATAIAIEMA